MLAQRIKLVHSGAGVALFVCLCCPLLEILLHSDGSIFVSGHDMESTLALVLVVIELSFAVARLLALVLPTIFLRLGIVVTGRVVPADSRFSDPLPAISPPTLLRI
jgi:hypothetical protein